MVNRKKIEAFINEVGRKLPPGKIMLFGSYANGAKCNSVYRTGG